DLGCFLVELGPSIKTVSLCFIVVKLAFLPLFNDLWGSDPR
ncbi:MAG: hypothetical protein ACJAUZ_003326, partial [Flavobacteriaceae bacterium]